MLFGRDGLFTLAEQLTGLDMAEDYHPRATFRGSPPVVLVEGRRGMGKSAPLARIAYAYGKRVPRAHRDLAGERYADGATSAPDSALLRLLRDLKWDLEFHVPHNGRIRFPRLNIALLAIETLRPGWRSNTEITLDQARQQLMAGSDAVAEIAHHESAWARGWLNEVLSDISGAAAPFPVDAFVRATVKTFLERTLPGRRTRREPLAWHERFDPRAPGDGYEALIMLSRDFSIGGDFRGRAEQRLVYRLRAVAGISVSTGQTISAVSWLTSRGIPVVGGAIVADNLANTPGKPAPFPGLARVEPTNSQEAAALAQFIKAAGEASKHSPGSKGNPAAGPSQASPGPATPATAHVVADLAPHDAYTSTLYQAFRNDTAWQVDTFDSSDQGNLPNDLENDARSICDQPGITWVYFAGRQDSLRQFIDKLVNGCQGRHFTILTGSAASHLVNDPPRKADFRWVTLDYVPIASPATWAGIPLSADGGSSQGYLGNPAEGAAGFQPAFAAAFPGDAATGLADGQAIINYDAVLTAVSALEDQTGKKVQVPSLLQMTTFWPLLHGHNTVFGASGLICLDRQGNPYDKVIPIVQYSATGTPDVVDRVFLNGAPTTSDCFVTNGG